jgi:hypothetical protein
MSSILNRIRSKSISSINQLTGNVQPTIPSGPPGYLYIENFEFTTEEECIKIDNENLNLYRKNKCLYEEITKKIEIKNALFKIEKPPSPPLEPNNYEKYVKYKQRNITRNVRLQTFAVQKLLEKGYRLHFELIDNKTEIDFEPYQAIELLEKIEDDLIENIFKNHYNSNKSSPQINKKNLSTSHPISSSPPQLVLAPEYSQYYHPQPSAPYYPPIYPSLTPSTLPPNHRNVAPPAAHYISNA